MPGYIIHLTEAEMILTALQQKGFSFDEYFHETFLLGALLPDTRRKREKETSHFWKKEDMENLAIPVNLSLFEEKYAGQIQSPLMLGYWAHLHLDEGFVRQFWPSMMSFIGEDGTEKVLRRDIRNIYLKKQKKLISVDDFFTSEYYYGDYDRTNHRFLKQFHLHIPVMREGMICPVEEVQIEDLYGVLEELQEMLKRDRTGDMELQVIPEALLLDFLENTAKEAAEYICMQLRMAFA